MAAERREHILGVRIDCTDYDTAVARIIRWAAEPRGRMVCASNAHMVMQAHDDAEFARILSESDLVVADGMSLAQISQELTDRSRTPLPQNVVYSLEDWGDQAGVLTLQQGRILSARKPELIDRFCAQSGLEKTVSKRLGPTQVELKRTVDLERLLDVARDLGFLIEERPEE